MAHASARVQPWHSQVALAGRLRGAKQSESLQSATPISHSNQHGHRRQRAPRMLEARCWKPVARSIAQLRAWADNARAARAPQIHSHSLDARLKRRASLASLSNLPWPAVGGLARGLGTATLYKAGPRQVPATSVTSTTDRVVIVCVHRAAHVAVVLVVILLLTA